MLVSVAMGLPRLPPLTYHTETLIQPGSRVLVPLGKRIVTGMVVPIEPEPFGDVRDVIEVLDEQPSIPYAVIELTRRLAEYYLCSWGEALMAAIPSGLTPGSVIRVELAKTFTDDELEQMKKRAPRRVELIRLLQQHKGDVTVQYLQKKLRTQTITDQLDALHRAGVVSVSTELEAETGPRMVRAARLSESFAYADDTTIASVFDELDKRAPKQSLALGQLYLAHKRGEGPITAAQLMSEVGASPAIIDALVNKGFATLVQVLRDVDDAPIGMDLISRDERVLELTPEQRVAVSQVALDRFQPYVLNGVTGSGKTLVYMRLMEEVLRNHKTCIMLVPEISLTPQLHDRFRAVFGNTVALLHSRMSMGERVRVWQRIANGEIPIVIGARSAVFAPLADVGLIVVDEEHEPSYKQDAPAPRYHGRDAAVIRANIEQCPIILGSATPSLESLHNVALSRYQLLRLTSRTDGAILPRINVVSIVNERTTGSMHGTLSATLVNAVRMRVERGEGTILFLNRRGFASQLVCSDCGHVASCPNCDVHLTWHKHSGALRCHYCGHTEVIRTACTVCGGIDLRDSGIGTQRVEEDLLTAFGTTPPTTLGGRPVVIARMDADAMRKRNAHRKILERFSRGEIDVIIGTQMVAKGLDIPRVTLVGVVLADQMLNQADFRAAERTVQLLLQVAGRAGRTAEHPGEVIVQTYVPQHEAIRAVTEGTIREWRDAELVQRRDAGYPPYSRFIVIEISGPDEAEVEHVAQVFDRLIPSNNPALVKHPPVVPSVAWIRHRHRRLIVMKNPKSVDSSGARARALIHAAISAYYENFASARIRVTLDIDASGTL